MISWAVILAWKSLIRWIYWLFGTSGAQLLVSDCSWFPACFRSFIISSFPLGYSFKLVGQLCLYHSIVFCPCTTMSIEVPRPGLILAHNMCYCCAQTYFGSKLGRPSTDNLCLGIPAGECFGLLGVNGKVVSITQEHALYLVLLRLLWRNEIIYFRNEISVVTTCLGDNQCRLVNLFLLLLILCYNMLRYLYQRGMPLWVQ